MSEQDRPLKRVEAYLNSEVWSYKGTEIDFMGVAHILETFKKFESEFRKRFSKADAILLEGAPVAEGIIDKDGRLSQETLAAYLAVYKGASEHEVRKMLEGENTSLAFFAALENLAGEMGKEVLVFDPFVMDPKHVSSNQELKRLSTQLKFNKLAVLGGLSMVAGTPSGALAARDLVKRNVSRRTVILGGAAAISAGLFATSVGSELVESGRRETPEKLNSSNLLSIGLADLTDYRNSAIVFTATRLADQSELPAHLGVVYGDVHRAQIRRGFENPWEGDLKLSTIYNEMVQVAPPRCRRFSNRGGKWVKTVDQVISR